MAGRVLIADIGGSSSRWAWAGANGPSVPQGLGDGTLPGFNPASGDGAALLAALRPASSALAEATHVHVYGAGCGSPERRRSMLDLLSDIWPAERITVESDLLGAARGMLQQKPGAILILGTGMNAGIYDGRQLTATFPSLGPLLGDEGSGADIGRHLWRDAIHGNMPANVARHLFGPQGPDREQLLREVYRGPAPGRFLAAPVAALHGVLEADYTRRLIDARFAELASLLAERFIGQAATEWHAVGSVAWGFRPMLADAMAARGLRLIAVARDPLRGLARYHG